MFIIERLLVPSPERLPAASPHLRRRRALPPSSYYRFFSPSPVTDLGPTQGRATCLLFLRRPTAANLTSRVPWNSLMWEAGCSLNALSVLLGAYQFPARCSYIFYVNRSSKSLSMFLDPWFCFTSGRTHRERVTAPRDRSCGASIIFRFAVSASMYIPAVDFSSIDLLPIYCSSVCQDCHQMLPVLLKVPPLTFLAIASTSLLIRIM